MTDTKKIQRLEAILALVNDDPYVGDLGLNRVVYLCNVVRSVKEVIRS